MSPWVKKLVEESGKSEQEIETLWVKAKKITAESFGTDEDSFTNREYLFAVDTVKRMLGFDEATLDPSNFLNSDRNANGFIESLVSTSFDIGDVNPPQSDEKEDEDEPMVDEEELEVDDIE